MSVGAIPLRDLAFFFLLEEGLGSSVDDSGRGAHDGPLIGGKECLAYCAEEPRE